MASKQRARPRGGNKQMKQQQQYMSASLCKPAGGAGAGAGASGAAQAPFGAASFTPGEVERIEALLKRKLDVGDVKQRKGQARARPQRHDRNGAIIA